MGSGRRSYYFTDITVDGYHYAKWGILRGATSIVSVRVTVGTKEPLLPKSLFY